MVGRVSIRLLIGILLVASPVGCLSTSRGPLPSSVTGVRPPSPEKDLPPQESARVRLKTAEDMEKGGILAEAIVLYEKARADEPDLDKIVCRRLASLYGRQGDLKHSLEEYRKALPLAPHDADLLNDYGYTLYSAGQFEEAEKVLRECLSVDPKNQRAWVNLGMTLGASERYAEGLEAFQHAVPEALAHCNLAFLMTAQGKRDLAREEYQKALLLEPDLALARNALAKLEHAEAKQALPAAGSSPSPASALPPEAPAKVAVEVPTASEPVAPASAEPIPVDPGPTATTAPVGKAARQ